jgi:hypothetical protein
MLVMRCSDWWYHFFGKSLALLSSYFVSVVALQAAEGFAVGSLDLGLTDQPGWWVWYNPVDSPEGAFFGTIYEDQNTLSGTIPFGRTLSPGRYYVACKVLDYGAGGSLDFNIGGASATAALNSADFNGQWTVPVPIDVSAESTNVQITFRRSNPLGARQVFLLRGLYVTPSQDELIFGDDSILNPRYPTQLDTSPARKGNILQNSGFEVGTGHGWGLKEGTSRSFPVASTWDENVGYEGTASIKLPNFADLVSRIYRLRGNRQFTLSAWVKTASAATVTLTIQNGGLTLPTNFPPAVFLSQTFPVSTSWQRISLSGVLLDYPTTDYYVRIKVNDAEGGYTWVDAVQLEEGALSDYSPGRPLEAGLISGQPSNLFYEDEPVAMQLYVRNSAIADKAATVAYEVYDYLNRRVATGSTFVTVPAHDHWVGALDLSTGQRGIFRVVLWVQGVEHSREEMVYGVVPRPQQTAMDTNSLIGIHADFTDFQCEALQKLGVKWNRTSSPSRAFHWKAIEPAEGAFQWTSENLAAADSRGISILGTLGLDYAWPAWADAGGLPDLTKWEAFVEEVVGHYKDQVKFWEIWNEPQWPFSADFYTQLLQRGTAAALRADPSAQIVGLGGAFTLSFATNVLANLGSNAISQLNSVSTHIYPKNAPSYYSSYREHVKDAYRVQVWNTEAGIWDRGFYLGENSDFIQVDYVWPQKAVERYDFGHRGSAELLAYAFLNSVGNGLSKFFYYDARIYAGPAYPFSHSTIFEYDDSIRAKGIAYAVLAKLFDHSAGLGNISADPNSIMYLFNRNGTPLLAMWSLDRTNRSLTLNLNSSAFQVYDLMGNTIAVNDGSIPYRATPVYVEGQDISLAALESAVREGTVIVRPDTTPPNLSLVVFPTGPTQENPIHFRWLAIDETSSTFFGPPKETENPSDGDPKAMQYSYYLQGYDADWSSWSDKTFVDYKQVPLGTYDFQVKARDAAGNVSDTNHFTLIVGGPPPSPLGLTAVLSDGVFVIRVSGGTNEGSIVIESSSDFLSWAPVHTNSASGGTFEFTDPAAGGSPRFYRAKQSP